MLNIRVRSQFKKDYKKAIKRGLKEEDFIKVVVLLRTGKELPKKYKDHALADSRNYKRMRDCHINPDWILIYQIKKNELILELVRTETHSDLF